MPPAPFLEELPGDSEWWALYKRELMTAVERIWRGGFMAGATIAAAAGSFNLHVRFKDLSDDDLIALNDEADRYIETHRDPWWDRLRESQDRALRDAIRAARTDGLQPREVARLIAGEFGQARAMRIAVTELTSVLGAGAQAHYRREGYLTWEWRTSMDDRVCPICAPREGAEFPMAHPFDAAHPNCRCWPVPGALPPDPD